jgi:hypothetical protein
LKNHKLSSVENFTSIISKIVTIEYCLKKKPLLCTHLDNLPLASNKETLSHTEVYKHFYQCFNILTQFKSYNDNNGNIERGVLAMPTCLYKAIYLRLIDTWNGIDEESVSPKTGWEEEESS